MTSLPFNAMPAVQSSLRANLICNLKHERAFAYYWRYPRHRTLGWRIWRDAENRRNKERTDTPDSEIGTRISERCNRSATKTNDANTWASGRSELPGIFRDANARAPAKLSPTTTAYGIKTNRPCFREKHLRNVEWRKSLKSRCNRGGLNAFQLTKISCP